MDAGDLVICRIIRNQSGLLTESHWIREVLDTDSGGNPTHACLVGNPTGELPGEMNTLDSQSAVVLRALSGSEKKVLEIMPELSRKPLDEKAGTTKELTYLQFLEILADIFGEE